MVPGYVKKLIVLIPIALLFFSCVSTSSWGNYGQELDTLSPEQWVRDLDTLENELIKRHPNPFHSVPENEFRNFLQSLRTRALSESFEDQELADTMVTGIYSALALLKEGHTAVNATPEIQYPVLLRRFRTPNGGWELRVAYGDQSLSSLLGQKVTSIGGRDPLSVLSQVSDLASAELPEGRVFFGQRLLSDPRIMRGLGIAATVGLSITVLSPEGEVTHLLQSQPRQTLQLVSQSLNSEGNQSGLPSSISFQSSGRYWYEVIDRTLYFRYNSSTTDAIPMMNEIVGLIEAGEVDRLILDLRFNGGGNSYPGTRFIQEIAETDVGRIPGRFYVLIGESTFSSAIMTAVDAMDQTEAIFVGTAMANPVNAWGEVKRFSLPESGLVIGHSSRFWNYSDGKALRLHDGVMVSDPGYEALWTYEEWVRGYDPALELILSLDLP